jgi:hypothetical protein
MKRSLLTRWSGLILIVGGVLLVICEVFTPAGDDLKVTLDPQWVALNTFGMITNLCVAFGLIGLYLDQADEGGGWGLLAFGLAFLACGLSIATAAIGAYVYPAFARMNNAPKLISELTGPTGPLALVGELDMAFGICFLVGFIFLGIITVRAGVLSRWPSWLLLISSAVGVTNMTGPALIGTLSNIVFGVALGWLGFLIWSGAKAEMLTSQPARA